MWILQRDNKNNLKTYTFQRCQCVSHFIAFYTDTSNNLKFGQNNILRLRVLCIWKYSIINLWIHRAPVYHINQRLHGLASEVAGKDHILLPIETPHHTRLVSLSNSKRTLLCCNTIMLRIAKVLVFIQPAQLDPWIKYLVQIILLSTILPLLLQKCAPCGRVCPSSMSHKFVTAVPTVMQYLLAQGQNCSPQSFNSSPLNKMAAISQTIFSDAFSWMKSFVFW